MGRLLQNLTTGKWHLRRLVSSAGALVITEAVRRAEQTTSAQIKVVVEAALKLDALRRGQTTRDRALEVFGTERVWDTQHNNGILLYLLVAEHTAEIVADRGFNSRVRPAEWSSVCATLAADMAVVGFTPAMVRAVESLGAIASRVYPSEGHANEMSDEVVVRS